MPLNEKEAKPFVKKIEKGNKLDEKKKHQEALKIYLEVWNELPETQLEPYRSVADWLMDCIVNCYMEQKDFLNAKSWAEKTLETERSKDEINYYEHFKMGEIYFELGDFDNAMKFFGIVYKRAQKRGFQGFNKKYWEFYSRNK